VILGVLDERFDVLRVVGELSEELLDCLLLYKLDGFDAGVLLLLIDRFGGRPYWDLVE